MAFDRSNIWVTNQSNNTVTKLSDCDGISFGMFKSGSRTTGIAFDGANVWVSNSGDGTLSKL